MNHYHAAALSRLLVEHIRLARSRCETLGWLIASILTAGTVNLTRLAPYIDSAAQITSVHRRLERFFSDVRLNQAEVARLVVAAVSLSAQPWHLAIERTNWQFGKTDLNILVLSVAHGNVCIPLFWRVLDKAGNSNTAERIDLMQVFKATFPDQAVASLTGDREFIANAWIEWLQQAAIPHFLRLREDMHVFNDNHAPLPLRQHGARLKIGQRLAQRRFGQRQLGSRPHRPTAVLGHSLKFRQHLVDEGINISKRIPRPWRGLGRTDGSSHSRASMLVLTVISSDCRRPGHYRQLDQRLRSASPQLAPAPYKQILRPARDPSHSPAVQQRRYQWRRQHDRQRARG